jgi:hypothetical protein
MAHPEPPRLSVSPDAPLAFLDVPGNLKLTITHQTIRLTPAMEAGLAGHVWSIKGNR